MCPASLIVITFLLFAVKLKFAEGESFQGVRIVNASFGNAYTYETSTSYKFLFSYGTTFPVSSEDFGEVTGNGEYEYAMRFSLSAKFGATLDAECPLIVLIAQKSGVAMWELEMPFDFLQSNRSFTAHTEKTVCLSPKGKVGGPLVLSLPGVEIFSCRKNPVKFTITAEIRKDYRVPLDKPITAQLALNSPAIYYVPPSHWEEKTNYLFLQMNSASSHCIIMSVQHPKCPIEADVNSIITHYQAQWQSATIKGGATIALDKYPGGFLIVFLLLPTDGWCDHRALQQPGVETLVEPVSSNVLQLRRKTITFMVEKGLSAGDFHLAFLLPLGGILVFTAFIFMVHLHFHYIRCKQYFNGSDLKPQQSEVDSLDSISSSFFVSRISIAKLMTSEPERLMHQTKRYCTSGLLASSFYCMPVAQLIYLYHKLLHETGNYDMCYYNYFCSHRLGDFNDFNHIYSNVGYVMFGIAFMGIVKFRKYAVGKVTREGGCLPRIPMDLTKGVFVHHGLFTTMGFSLTIVGFLSSAYHVCPNQKNFQFDTAFMYTVAALGIVTIFQFRHPTYVSATITFLALAVLATLTVIGLLWENQQFRLFFTASHLAFLLVILTYVHYIGYIRENGCTVSAFSRMLTILAQKWVDDIKHFRLFEVQKEEWRPANRSSNIVVFAGPCRLLFPLTVLGVNSAALLLVWTAMYHANFASQVLAVYIINCAVYMVYYTLMKWVHGECKSVLWAQPCFYLFTAFILWVFALYYFGDAVTLWERSPAESRAKNADCIFLSYYDSHDVWHFLSSAALFTSFMALLTCDDDIVERPKSAIPVF